MKQNEEELKTQIILYVLFCEMYVRKRYRKRVLFCLMGLYTSKTIVPDSPDEVNTWLTNTDARQLAIPEGGIDPYYKLYNWLPAESAAFHQKKLAWDILYAKYKDSTKVTSPIREQVANFITTLHTFAEKYIRKVRSSECTEDDASIFHFKYIRKKRTIRTTKIEEACYAIIESAGTCALKGKVRTASDAKRSSILTGTSGVEVAVKVLWRVGQPEITGIPKLVPDKTWSYQQFSNSIFDLAFEAEDSGAIVQICCRWFILGKPQFAGPWTVAEQIRVG